VPDPKIGDHEGEPDHRGIDVINERLDQQARRNAGYDENQAAH